MKTTKTVSSVAVEMMLAAIDNAVTYHSDLEPLLDAAMKWAKAPEGDETDSAWTAFEKAAGWK